MGVSAFHRYSKRVTRTRQWTRLRFEALRRDNWQCVQCGARGRLEVDHILPVRTHPELAYVLDNVQVLCPADHARKTRVECGHRPVHPGRIAWRAALLNVPEN